MFFWNSLTFFHDPADVDNLISGSSALYKTSLSIWNFMVHILLNPGLENFEHYFTREWDECNCAVVWAFFGIAILWDWNENWPFHSKQAWGHCWAFQIFWHIECSTSVASPLRIWNSSTGIPSPPLALIIVMLPKAHLTSHSRISGSRWVITPLWLYGSLRSFLYSSVYSCHLFLIPSASVRSIPFLFLPDTKTRCFRQRFLFFCHMTLHDKHWILYESRLSGKIYVKILIKCLAIFVWTSGNHNVPEFCLKSENEKKGLNSRNRWPKRTLNIALRLLGIY